MLTTSKTLRSDSDAEPVPASASGSEVESLVSSADTGVESDAEGSLHAAESLAETFPIPDFAGELVLDDVRAARGAYVVWSNGYFTLTDNPSWPDVKVTALPRWTRPGFFGNTQKSKTVVPGHFGESRQSPCRAYAVCRAWSIWRASQGDFLTGSTSRRRTFAQELELLRAELHALGHGGRTGNALADEMIAGWVPDAFPAP